MLVEASWTAIRSPGPLRAFAERVRAKRGANKAAVAVARKLAVLCWHLLSKEEDYAFARPSLTVQKLRRVEVRGWRQAAAVKPRRAAGQSHTETTRGGAPAPSSGRAGLPPVRFRLEVNKAA